MIYYVKGAITFKSPTYVLVEAGGIGYQVFISLNTYAQIEKLETVKLLTYHYVKEDTQALYGFFEAGERTLFSQLIGVSGIGPSTAQLLLSSMNPTEAQEAILAENVSAFNKVKGIGPKTAKRIILDLKDKIMKESGAEAISVSPADNTIRQEALSALLALGFNRTKVQKVLNDVLKENPKLDHVEELIKKALQKMA